MFVFVELSARETYHAPFNAGFLQTICLAFPQRRVECWADATHLGHLQSMLAPALENLTLRKLRLFIPPDERYELASFRRLGRYVHTLYSLVRKSGRGPTVLIVSGAAPEASLAAAIIRLLFWRRELLIQLPLHGQLNMVRGWRSRNPFHRGMDLKSALSTWHGRRFRYLVFEEHIREALARLVPRVAGSVDVLPHPINIGEGRDTAVETTARYPLRLALLGVATRSKGFDIFLRLANSMKREFPGKLEFDVIGHIHREFAAAELSSLAEPATSEDLPRQVFIERLKRAHFICLLFEAGGYYDLSASGTLIDAMTWRKPVIASKHPLMDRLFADFGDIGYECASERDLFEVVRKLAQTFDPERYLRQVEAVSILRDSRTPEAGAGQYRALLERFLANGPGVSLVSDVPVGMSVDRP